MSNAANPPDMAPYLALNRANWDERVGVHMGTRMYDLSDHRRGEARLAPIEMAALGDVSGLDVFHPQCHFGLDTMALLQMGAKSALGLDFSGKAIAAARDLATEFGLADRAQFVEATVQDGIDHVLPGAFDLAFVTWGTIYWLPDLNAWARLIAHALRPGGRLYFADGHPAMLVLDDSTPFADGTPGYFVPYFHKDPFIFDDPGDYANETAVLKNSKTCEWMHTVSDIVMALINAGLRIETLHEHDAIPWQAFSCLVRGEDRLYRWPDKAWLPLALSISARKA